MRNKNKTTVSKPSRRRGNTSKADVDTLNMKNYDSAAPTNELTQHKQPE